MKVLLLIFFIPALLVLQVISVMSGKREKFVSPGKGVTSRFGDSDKALKYVVIGDSITAGQGADYEKGIAIETAKHLGKTYKVTMRNFSVSGSRVQDILKDQVPVAIKEKPDIVLISSGANDVTKFVLGADLEKNLRTVVNAFVKSNCDVKR